MENLHAPTVSSGPTSARANPNGTGAGLTFPQLNQRKENLEGELKALSGVLDSHGVTMETPLLTRDGFPRSDIDVAQIRTTRTRIIRLRNDYKELMGVIEKHLHEHFANLAQAGAVSEPEAGAAPMESTLDLPDSAPEELDPAFAKVNTVTANSPAERSGLRPGDLIRNFGYVNSANHDNLKKVAECVQGNEGSTILIKVSRPGDAMSRQELRLNLTPSKDWGGRGSLGCHILPL